VWRLLTSWTVYSLRKKTMQLSVKLPRSNWKQTCYCGVHINSSHSHYPARAPRSAGYTLALYGAELIGLHALCLWPRTMRLRLPDKTVSHALLSQQVDGKIHYVHNNTETSASYVCYAWQSVQTVADRWQDSMITYTFRLYDRQPGTEHDNSAHSVTYCRRHIIQDAEPTQS